MRYCDFLKEGPVILYEGLKKKNTFVKLPANQSLGNNYPKEEGRRSINLSSGLQRPSLGLYHSQPFTSVSGIDGALAPSTGQGGYCG